jgi:hypothetical protein
MLRTFALLGMTFVVGCGARSSLLDGTGEGGASPTTDAVVAPVGATASSGSTGGFMPCTELTVREATVLFDSIDGRPAHDAALLAGAPGATLAARFAGPPDSGTDSLVHAALDAWTAWPPPHATPQGTNNSVWSAAPAYTSHPDGTFDLSFVDGMGCLQMLGAGLEPEVEYDDVYPFFSYAGQGCSRRPLAVAYEPEVQYIVATAVQPPGLPDASWTLETLRIEDFNHDLWYELPACGVIPPSADLQLLGDRVVLATSNASPSFVCEQLFWLPRYLAVGFADDAAPAFTAEGFDEIVGVELLAGAQGPWVLYRESGASALQSPPVVAQALDAALQPTLVPFEATGPGLSRFSATELAGGGFVIVSDESSDSVIVRAFDATGAKLAEVEVPTPDDAQERLAVVASPEGDSALVAWTAGPAPQRVLGARIDCLRD